VVYRFDASLFFANARLLADDVPAAVAEGAATLPVRWVVIDAEAIGEVDAMLSSDGRDGGTTR
jgi:MFS superfamily sulfate permease-like transporter